MSAECAYCALRADDGPAISLAAKLTSGQTITAGFGGDGRDAAGDDAGNDKLAISGVKQKPKAVPVQKGINISDIPLITAAQAGGIFGSSIGQYIGGKNTFARVAAGSAKGRRKRKYYAPARARMTGLGAARDATPPRFRPAPRSGVGSAKEKRPLVRG